MRRLVDLSRTRLPRRALAEADRVLDAADARERLSRRYTTVAIAGATGSGKSSLFNALAGTRLSQAGMRRPTTATPVACSWEVPGAGPADGLLDRLGIPPSTRRLMRPESDWRGRIDEEARSELEGLVLIDMPDHDSAAEGHREQVERLLRLVDAVVWVVDPEKYADAVLHERYLRPLAGYAEVTFIVLNQTDRLPGDATDAVLNDLRRLLDEDGMALGDHGEPGARVLATSALVGEGVDELRAELAGFVAERRAASLRLSADLDVVVERLRPEYEPCGSVPAATAPSGLTEDVREDFSGRLARAAGAVAAGQAAERAWRRYAERACGTPWAQLQHWYEDRRSRKESAPDGGATVADVEDGGDFGGPDAGASEGLPGGALDEDRMVRPAGDGANDRAAAASPSGEARPRVARPLVAHAVRSVVEEAAAGLPEAWRRSVRDAAWRGASGLPEALDDVLSEDAEQSAAAHGRAGVPHRPVWWSFALTGQLALLLLQLAGAACVLCAALGMSVVAEWAGVALFIGGVLGGSLLSWGCRFAARGPAAEYGRSEERRLRRLVAGCGQVHVLEPVAAELLRFREVREQYVIAAGDTSSL
nr:GTPase [Streptomyces nanshensis]